MKVSDKLLRGKGQQVPSIYVEKASVSSEGNYAKILFRLGTSLAGAKEAMRNPESLAEAFNAKMEGSVRLVTSSIHKSDVDGMYCAYVAINTPTITHTAAVDAGFSMVAANLFADADDNIWRMTEVDGEKVLSRTANDDLGELLRTRVMSPSVSTAAAGYCLDGAFKAGTILAFYDNTSETVRKGVSVDAATAFDFSTKKFYPVATTDVVATTEPSTVLANAIDSLYGDKNITFAEVASDYPRIKENIRRYLTTLYGQNKAFLDTYLRAIDRLLVA